MSHPNTEILRRAYDAYSRGDNDSLSTIFADDISFSIPGKNPLAGEHKGQGAVFAMFGRVAELSGGTFRLDPHAILAEDDHAVALIAASGERNGKRAAWNTVHVFHVDEGKLTEFWEFPDQPDFDDFWS